MSGPYDGDTTRGAFFTDLLAAVDNPGYSDDWRQLMKALARIEVFLGNARQIVGQLVAKEDAAAAAIATLQTHVANLETAVFGAPQP